MMKINYFYKNLLMFCILMFICLFCKVNYANYYFEKECIVGDTIKFGRYEQDCDIDNGAEELEWLVIENNHSYTELVTKFVIDCKSFDDNNDYKDFKDSDLFYWLNDYILWSCFNEEEQLYLQKYNDAYICIPNEDCITKIKKELGERSVRAFPTSYAIKHGADIGVDGYTSYWLSEKGNNSFIKWIGATGKEYDSGQPQRLRNGDGIRLVIRLEKQGDNDVFESMNINSNKYKNVHIGDYITLGKYEQNGNMNDGKEKIEWVVVGIEGNKAKLISKNIIDFIKIKDGYKLLPFDMSYESEYLNSIFFNEAFNDNEKEMIIPTEGSYYRFFTGDLNKSERFSECYSTMSKITIPAKEDIDNFKQNYFEVSNYVNENILSSLGNHIKVNSYLVRDYYQPNDSDEIEAVRAFNPNGLHNTVKIYNDNVTKNLDVGIRPLIWINCDYVDDDMISFDVSKSAFN